MNSENFNDNDDYEFEPEPEIALSINSRAHDELIREFERDFSGSECFEKVDILCEYSIYTNKQTNNLFFAYRRGFLFGIKTVTALSIFN